MPSDSSPSTLRRMAGLAPPEAAPEVSAPPSPLEQALVTAALRVADGIPALALGPRAQTSGGVHAAEAFDGLPEMGLCLMIDPPTGAPPAGQGQMAQATGALILDGVLVDSLIEVQTIGRLDGAARPARRPTRIDAALVQPFCQSLIEEVAAALPTTHWGPRPGALRTGTYLAGIQSLPMVLTASGFQRVAVEVELAQGARTSTLTLLLPDVTAQPDTPEVDVPAPPDPKWDAAIREIGEMAEVTLESVLPPLRMTLADLVALRPGDVLDLDDGALQDLRLVSGTSGHGSRGRQRMPHGVRISARLGQLAGHRAVCIQGTPDDPDPLGGQGDAGGAGAVQAGTAVAPVSGGPGMPPDGGADLDMSLPVVQGAAGDPTLSDLDLLADLPDLPDLPEA